MAVEQGDKAPDFSLAGLDGGTYRLAEALERGPTAWLDECLNG